MSGPMNPEDEAELMECFPEAKRFVIFDPLILPRAFYSHRVARDLGAAHAWSSDLAKASEFPSKAEALAYVERQMPGTRVAVMERT